ncbi:MAG TPA: C25 family cysteine peptidase [Blastocatellia bacterium]
MMIENNYSPLFTLAQKIVRVTLLPLIFCFALSAATSAQTYPAAWPSDAAFASCTKLGTAIRDLRTDANDLTDGGTGVNPDSVDTYDGGARNSAGTLTTVYYYYDSVNEVLFFRMRLLGDPRQSGGLSNGTWDVIFDTDGDGWKEFFIEVNGNSSPDFINIYYGDTDQQDIPNGFTCATNGQGRVWNQEITLGTHVRVTAITGGGFFLDYQVPLSAFKDCSGTQLLGANTPVQFIFTTSQTTQNPIQKDLVGLGEYTMSSSKLLPSADITLIGGLISQVPLVTSSAHTCGAGTNFSPITLTATVMDTLDVSGTGGSATVVDTTSNVTFFYRRDGTNTWTQIAGPVTSPLSGTLNKWSVSWNTSSLVADTYWIKVVVTDNQGNVATDTVHGVNLINCNSITYVDLMSFGATGDESGQVLLQWKTGYEINNLGFNIYREVAGQRARINPSILAGSALLAGKVALTAGQSYTWMDRLPSAKEFAQYWLEDVDLKGKTTLHGPISPMAGKLTTQAQSLTLSRLSSGPPPVEARAAEQQIISASHAGPEGRARSTLSAATQNGIQTQWDIASQAGVKLMVRGSGWYRVNQPDLAAAGLDVWRDSRFLQLYADGEEIPIIVNGGRNGRLEAADSIEFYATGLDTPSTDFHTYYLLYGRQAGRRIGVTPAGAGAQGHARSFPMTIERKERSVYFITLKNGDRDNWFGPVITSEPVEQPLTVKRLDRDAVDAATIEVAVQGATSTDSPTGHVVKATLNGVEIGTLDFDGEAHQVSRMRVPNGVLREGENTLSLRAQGGEMDISVLDYVRLTYPHTYMADDSRLLFTLDGSEAVRVGGFNDSKIRVFDITDADAPQEIQGSIESGETDYAVTVASSEAGQRTLLALTPGQSLRPEAIIANQPSSWNRANQGADLLIISHASFIPGLEPLKRLRRAQGYQVSVVDVEDVYDEFGYGARSPEAIKDFLARARASWRKPPQFVLLVGDASFDPKNHMRLGDWDLVPTKLIETAQMETASDDWLADFNTDGLPEMAVGRLPARSPQEAAIMVAKIVSYEQAGRPEGVLLIADKNDGFDFEGVSRRVKSLVPAGVPVREVLRSQLDDAAASRRTIEGINSGARLVNYLGHGSVQVWRGNLLTSSDAASLTNEKGLSLVVSMTCLNGFYHDPYLESLAESLIKSEHGGAVAMWASSTLTGPTGQSLMNREVVRQIFSADSKGRALTIGEATARAKAAVADVDVRRSWILFGDPATRLK